MLITTVLTMGAATTLIGALPTYDQIGTLAPVALHLLRLLQDLTAGGERGGSALVAVEHAPPGQRGLYGSWSMVGISGGALLSSGAFALLAGMDQQAFLAWGWRIPILASAVLIVVGFWVRRTITEPEAFRTAQETGTTVRLPLAQLLRTSWRTVLLTTGVSIGYTAYVYLIFTFALTYSTTELHLPRRRGRGARGGGRARRGPAGGL